MLEIREIRISKMLDRIADAYADCDAFITSNISTECLRREFKNRNYNSKKQLSSPFELMNAQEGKFKPVGSIENSLVLYENTSIIYPGGVATSPLNSNPYIDFVYLGGHLYNPIPFDFLAYSTHIGG